MKIAILMTNISRYSGGRVHVWTLAYALKELGHDVTVYTDAPAGYILNDLRGRKIPKVEVLGSREYPDVKADLYLGMPISPNEAAARLAEKYGGKAKALCCVFDTWPALDRAGVKWDEYPRKMPHLVSDRVYVLSLAEANNQDIVGWLGIDPDHVKVVHPCINDKALREVGEVKPHNSVVFVSRLVGHKHLDHLIKAARPLGVTIVVISSDRGKPDDAISWHIRVNDRLKFELLKAARCLCVPSTQEGFGIWATEAWACGVPAVCYDLPTIREIDQGGTFFAEPGDWKDLQRRLVECLEKDKRIEPDERFYFGRLVERMEQVIGEVCDA